MNTRSEDPGRSAFPHFLPIATRWMDNDSYGHVNNVVYYSYFDTVVNEHLIRAAGLDIRASPVIGLVVETRCIFRRSLSFPEIIDAGLAVRALGRTSVTYAIGLFRQGEAEAAAIGHFVHVWVERATDRPVAVPDTVRTALAPLIVPGS
jgi:acyl-CoA thioester hydrolase